MTRRIVTFRPVKLDPADVLSVDRAAAAVVDWTVWEFNFYGPVVLDWTLQADRLTVTFEGDNNQIGRYMHALKKKKLRLAAEKVPA